MAAQGVLGAARVPYGARGDFPPAVDMGDKALYVDPSDNQALWQVQSGNWVKIALGGGGGGGATPGVPVLHGPYVIDFGDIPHDGDTKALWTPQVGDIILFVVVDTAAAVGFDNPAGLASASLSIGQDLAGAGTPWSVNVLGGAFGGFLTPGSWPSSSNAVYHIQSTDPIEVRYLDGGDGDLTAGHTEVYALVARAVAP